MIDNNKTKLTFRLYSVSLDELTEEEADAPQHVRATLLNLVRPKR